MPGFFRESNVQREVIAQRMQQHVSAQMIRFGREEIRFEEITSKAGIDQILVIIAAASGDRDEVIDGQFTPGIVFTDAAIPAAAVVAGTHVGMLRMRHELLSDSEELSSLPAEPILQRCNPRIQLLSLPFEFIPFRFELSQVGSGVFGIRQQWQLVVAIQFIANRFIATLFFGTQRFPASESQMQLPPR